MADLQQRAINALDNAQREQEYIKEQLLHAARTISDDMIMLTKHLNEGHVVNSLGELQSRGSNLDRLCALYAAAEERVGSYRYVLTEPVYCNCNKDSSSAVCGGRVNDETDTLCSVCKIGECYH